VEGKVRPAPYTSARTVSEIATSAASAAIGEIQSQLDLNQKFEVTRRIISQVIQRSKTQAEWDINDHGFEHSKRVERNVESLVGVLDTLQLIEDRLERPLTEQELFMLKIAALSHDIGRAMGVDKDHAEIAEQFIRNTDDLPLTSEQRKTIANLCILHANGSTQDRFGSADLNELSAKGAITKLEAVLASILRVADALDVGKNRATHNTQGTPIDEVIERIKAEHPEAKAKARLSHLYGHMGIHDAVFTARKNHLSLEIRLDQKLSVDHGEDVAHRVKDLIRDVRSALIGKKIIIRLTASNLKQVEDWYNKYQFIFYDDIEGMDVQLEGQR
jgi:hypothetical protein